MKSSFDSAYSSCVDNPDPSTNWAKINKPLTIADQGAICGNLPAQQCVDDVFSKHQATCAKDKGYVNVEVKKAECEKLSAQAGVTCVHLKDETIKHESKISNLTAEINITNEQISKLQDKLKNMVEKKAKSEERLKKNIDAKNKLGCS